MQQASPEPLSGSFQDEILELLLRSRDPIPIEKLLMESIPQKSFQELGLLRTYPKIYRGLPRLYHRDNPSSSHIKRNFSHLPSLKKQVVLKAICSLYSKLPVQGKVTLFTWAIGDGLGDYAAAVSAMQILRSRLPQVEFSFIGLIPRPFASLVHPPQRSEIIYYEGECPLSLLTPQALAALRQSDLILQLPTFYPHTQELIETLQAMPSDLPFPKIEAIGEYGFVESSWFHPKSGAISLGLHFLEKGILVSKPHSSTWDDVQNSWLLAKRDANHKFYLAYLSSPIGGAIYLHALLKSLENDLCDVDLCVPDLSWFIQFVEKQSKAGRALLEWDLGVESIEVHFGEKIHFIPLAASGKKVRLLCPGQLSPRDFRALLNLSDGMVAVREDQSFSEAISQNKPFFYDGREHARYFLKDLCAIAENRIQNYPGTLTCIRAIGQAFLYNLPVQEGDWVEETFFQPLEEWTAIALGMGLALQEEGTFEGYQKFNQILVDEYPANGFLAHLVQRALWHQKYPQIGKREAQELELFASAGQTFSQMIQSLLELLHRSPDG